MFDSFWHLQMHISSWNRNYKNLNKSKTSGQTGIFVEKLLKYDIYNTSLFRCLVPKCANNGVIYDLNLNTLVNSPKECAKKVIPSFS